MKNKKKYIKKALLSRPYLVIMDVNVQKIFHFTCVQRALITHIITEWSNLSVIQLILYC